MEPILRTAKLSGRRPSLRLAVLVACAGLLGVVVWVLAKPDQKYILYPSLAALTIFMVFSAILRSWVGKSLFGEIGFLYLALGLAYTLFPAFTFVVLDLDIAAGWVWQSLSQLLPAPYELGLHLWRHVLFLAGVSAGYLLFRGRKVAGRLSIEDVEGKDGRTIFFLIVVLLVCILCMSLLSAPVTTYIDNYTRYDHLSWFPRKFVSLCNRMKQGFYVALITLLFINGKKYKITTFLVVLGMCIFDVVYSYGSRIESLIVLLMAICLYHFFIKTVTLKKGLLACLSIGAIFSAVELFRASDFDFSHTRSVVSEGGMQPASEFGAVYFTGFHLYAEREQGTMASKEWPMFFNDFISLVTPNDFQRWNPQYWYARAYFPDAVVPPETMGPIPDSAIWGGEIDLLVRSLINGAFFAYLIRWFIRRKGKWWAVTVYVFCYATCIMSLKYSVFYHLNPLFKTFLPTVLLIMAFRKGLSSKLRLENGYRLAM